MATAGSGLGQAPQCVRMGEEASVMSGQASTVEDVSKNPDFLEDIMTTATTHAPLSVTDALALAAIVKMAHAGDKVVYLRPEEDREIRGVARHLTSTSGGIGLDSDLDIRDAHLRITLSSGLEAWYPVADLVAAFKRREFVSYDWS